MKKRVYTLYRVSTKGQVEKDDIPMQKEACRNFAESQGWEIVKEFSEKGVSGFKKSAKDRDELQKIQQAAMEGKFDILLVFMFDRLGRRDDETPFIVEWFTKQGIEVWSVNEGQQRFDTHVDKLMNYIRYWQASGESLKTSVRTRTRLEQLTGEGHYTGGTVAFGYKRVRLGRVNKKNQEVCDLVIDEAEAEIVRLIFHKYVYEGYGAQKLSHYLYEQGVVGRNNKNIPNTSIVRMIKNKGYTGYLINGAVETECPQLRIIEPELFEQAQELRQARTCERGGTSLGTSSKALLTGLVYCGHCGNRLSLTSSGRTHTYADGHTVKEVRPRYSCFYKIRHPGDCDGQSGYGVSKLDSIVEEVVRQIFAQFREVSRKKLLESVKTNDAARIQKKVKKIQKDLESKQKELDDLKAETILVIRGVSALDKELLGTLVAEAREALETLEKQLVQAQEEYEEATKTAKRSNYICNELFTWADVYDTANHDERRAILQQFIKEIRVRKDYEISITLNASFNQVEQLKSVSIYDGAEIFEEISEKGAFKNLRTIPVTSTQMVLAKIIVLFLFGIVFCVASTIATILCGIGTLEVYGIGYKLFLAVETGIFITAGTLPLIVLVVFFSKTYVFSILLCVFYSVLNMSATALFDTLPKTMLWLLPTPLTTFWSAGDMAAHGIKMDLEQMTGLIPSTFQVVFILGIMALVSFLLIDRLYKQRGE